MYCGGGERLLLSTLVEVKGLLLRTEVEVKGLLPSTAVEVKGLTLSTSPKRPSPVNPSVWRGRGQPVGKLCLIKAD